MQLTKNHLQVAKLLNIIVRKTTKIYALWSYECYHNIPLIRGIRNRFSMNKYVFQSNTDGQTDKVC